MTTQSDRIKHAIVACIRAGMTDKCLIYGRVEGDLKVPRPTIRRVASALRSETAAKIRMLERRLLEAETFMLERRREDAAARLACLA